MNDELGKLWKEGAVACFTICAISGFCCDVDEMRALLGYYAALCGSSVPTFRDNLSVPSSSVMTMDPTVCPETSVKKYHSTLRNIPEERRYQLQGTVLACSCRVSGDHETEFAYGGSRTGHRPIARLRPRTLPNLYVLLPFVSLVFISVYTFRIFIPRLCLLFPSFFSSHVATHITYLSPYNTLQL